MKYLCLQGTYVPFLIGLTKRISILFAYFFLHIIYTHIHNFFLKIGHK